MLPKAHRSLRGLSGIPLIAQLTVCALLWCRVACLPVAASSATIESWDKIQREGSAALDAGEYWRAEPLLKEAVIAAGSFGMADLHLAKSFDELGRLYTIRGRFDEAEPYLEEALFIKQQAIGTLDGKTIPAMGSLIRFYLTCGTAKKADPLTEQLLSFIEGKLKEPAGLSTFKVKLQKGVPLQGWAGVAQSEAANPAIEWAIACDDIGNLYRLSGNFDLAYRLFKAALDVKSTVLGKEHLSLANSYDNLGSLYQTQNNYAECESFFADALDISEKILPPDDPVVYGRLDKLAQCFIKSEKYKQAEDLYLRAKNFWATEPSKYGDDARAALALGSLYCQEKNYAAAAPVLKTALDLSEQFNGPSSVKLVPYLQKYAYALYYLGEMQEVDQLHARANTISGIMQ